jgi:hypothetical protein
MSRSCAGSRNKAVVMPKKAMDLPAALPQPLRPKELLSAAQQNGSKIYDPGATGKLQIVVVNEEFI